VRTLKAGDRVEVTGVMPNDPDPLPIGSRGTVRNVFDPGSRWEQVDVVWDNGRTLMLLGGVDPYELVEEET
jgi:hypothetical protein